MYSTKIRNKEELRASRNKGSNIEWKRMPQMMVNGDLMINSCATDLESKSRLEPENTGSRKKVSKEKEGC